MVEVPKWYTEIAADEAVTDARILEQRRRARKLSDSPNPLADFLQMVVDDTVNGGSRDVMFVPNGTVFMDEPSLECPHTDSISYGAGECDECHDERVAHEVHVTRSVTSIHCPLCVPSVFRVPTPEPVDYSVPPCEREV